MNKCVGIIVGVSAAFLWAVFPGIIKQAIESTDVILFLLLRYIFSTILLSYFITGVVEKSKSIPKKLLISIFALAVLNNGTQALCLQGIPVIWYILFFSCSPIITLSFVKRERTYGVYACYLMSLLGTVVFLNPFQKEIWPSFNSTLLLFICILSWAILVKLIDKIQDKLTDIEISCLLNICNLISFAFIFSLSGSILSINQHISLTPILLLGFLSPLASYFFSYSIRCFPAFGVASQYLTLVFGFCIGMFFFDESPTIYQWIGTGVIILSLYLLTTHKTFFPLPKNENITNS